MLWSSLTGWSRALWILYSLRACLGRELITHGPNLIYLSLDIVGLLVFLPVRAELVDLACHIPLLIEVISLQQY